MANHREGGLSLGRNMLWNSAGSLFYFACQYLPTILVVRLAAGLTASGVFNYAMNTTNAFLTVAVYGMRTFQVSDLDAKYTDRAYLASRWLTSAAALAACAGYGALVGLDGETLAALVLFMLFRVGEALVDVYSGIDQRADRMDVIGKSFFARGALSCAAFAGVLASGGSVLLAIAGMAAASLAVALLFDRRWAARLSRPGGGCDAVFPLLAECAPLMVYSFLNTAVSTIPRQFLQLWQGTEATAVYGSITAPTVILQLGATYLFTPLIGLFATRWQAGRRRDYARLFLLVLAGIAAIGAAGFAGVALLGRWGLALLYASGENGRQILENAPLLFPMVACTILTALVLFCNMLLTIQRQFKALVAANLAGIAASVALSAALVGRLSMWGASFALAGSLAVQAVFLLCFGVAGAAVHFNEKGCADS